MAATSVPERASALGADHRRVITASVLGTVLEWYDFFLYSSLAGVIGSAFFGAYPPATRDVFALLVFALGFMARPFGALLWGHWGDRIGRRRVFLLTVVVMGAATVLVGLLPTAAMIGLAAPALLVALRVIQGLAISGEFGGAVTYVAENAPPRRRGLYTSAIPASIAGGLLLSLVVVLLTQAWTGADRFAAWGWRIPFLASAALAVVSVLIRRSLAESPVFAAMRARHQVAASPIREAFGSWRNIRLALVALFGLSTTTAVLGYAGTSFSLTFLSSAVHLALFPANIVFAIAIALGAGLCVLVSWLSDLIGRKPVVVGSALLAAGLYLPVFGAIVGTANPALQSARSAAHVFVSADPATCSFQFNPASLTSTATSACDVARSALSAGSVPYQNRRLPAGAPTTVTVNGTTVAAGAGFQQRLNRALSAAGFAPGESGAVAIHSVSDVFRARTLALIGLLMIPILLAQMAQGPAAAMLVELFPARVRYTALSMPYQLATGWIGGLLPAIVFAINVEYGDILAGIWYPVGFAVLAFLVGLFFLPETRRRDITA